MIILLRVHTIHDVQRLSRHQKCETQKHHISRYGTASVTLLDSIVTQHVMKYLDQHSSLSQLEMTQVWGHDNCSPGASGIIFTRFSIIMEKIKTSSLQLLQRIIES